ncbi:MAG TPA: DUF488 domain-containing protein [Actinomycetota bacterium]|nr:DUF488 domain-containing protein [Actinomycetota bacterium]
MQNIEEERPAVFTIGHGTLSLEEFLAILIKARVDLLVDVRRYPGSRRNPHFGRDELQLSLPAAGLVYEWWGETLGGRRSLGNLEDRHVAWRNTSFRAYAAHMGTPGFRIALDSLQRRAVTFNLAIMCAETLWWRCHRRLIADALVVKGFEVVHLGLGTDRMHVLTQTARVLENGELLYDVDRAGG